MRLLPGEQRNVAQSSGAEGVLWLLAQELDLGQPMPKVGKKKFAYTKKGKAAAKKHAKKTGKKVKSVY